MLVKYLQGKKLDCSIWLTRMALEIHHEKFTTMKGDCGRLGMVISAIMTRMLHSDSLKTDDFSASPSVLASRDETFHAAKLH